MEKKTGNKDIHESIIVYIYKEMIHKIIQIKFILNFNEMLFPLIQCQPTLPLFVSNLISL